MSDLRPRHRGARRHVLSIIAGLVFLFTPSLSLAALVLMTGISAIVIGAGELVLAFQLRKVRA
jgi:uncharacterized membrane protein HdeD (DUF308 family)